MKENNEYTNCHDFTSEYIVEFAVESQLKEAARNYRNSDRCPISYWRVLNELSGSEKMQRFYQANCAALQVPGLILFCTPIDDLQHSMIVYDADAWVGANNIGSLGALDTYVHKYLNMSSKEHQYSVQGGWHGQDFRSRWGDEYNMYYIPFKVNDDGANYNRRMRNDGGCCTI